MTILKKLDKSLFTEESQADIDWDNGGLECFGTKTILDVPWFEQHAVGYHRTERNSKYGELILVMFEFDGELCWFIYFSTELESMNVHLG